MVSMMNSANHRFLCRNIFRSKSLPRNLGKLRVSNPKNSELDAIDLDANLLARMQRWILGLVIGMIVVYTRIICLTLTSSRHLRAVDFDLDVGPTVHGTFPAAILSESESENV